MLPREKRITSNNDFKRVYQKGSFFSTPFFNVNFLKNHFGKTRIGIVVGKKVDNKAVVRNLIKRRIREAIGSLYDELASGYDVVITVKKDAVNKSYAQIETIVQGITTRITSEKNNNSRN